MFLRNLLNLATLLSQFVQYLHHNLAFMEEHLYFIFLLDFPVADFVSDK